MELFSLNKSVLILRKPKACEILLRNMKYLRARTDLFNFT